MDSTTSAIKLAEEWGVRLDAMGDGSIAGIKTKVAPSHANATIAEIIVNDLRKRAPSLGLDSVIGEIKRLQPSSHDDDASTKPRLAAAYKDVRLVLNRLCPTYKQDPPIYQKTRLRPTTVRRPFKT